jgi:steroid delta-isomerase-like uncharacterized protein
MATAEDVATAIRWHHEIFLARQVDAAHRILAPDFEWHSPLIGAEPVRGPDAVAELARTFLDAYPDLDLPHLGTVAEGDQVVTRWRLTGTAEKPVGAFPGNGKRIDISGIDWFVLREGRLHRLHQELDLLGWATQLGEAA